MRPKIGDFLVDKMEMETEYEDNSGEVKTKKLFEIGGYESKSEFVRHAVREKIKEHKEKYMVGEDGDTQLQP